MTLRTLLTVALLAACGDGMVDLKDYAYTAPDGSAGAADDGRRVKVPRVLMSEPTQGPWDNNNNWGLNTKPGPLPAAAGSIIGLTELNRPYGPPSVYTVHLSRSNYVQDAGSNADVRAVINYGSGAFSNEFEIDWSAGVQFSLVASRIRVSAVTYAPDSDSAYSVGASPGPVNLGVSFGKGTVPGGKPVTWTSTTEVIGAGDDRTVLVPDFAKEFFIMAATGSAGNSNPAVATGITFGPLIGSVQEFFPADCQVFANGARLPILGGTNALLISNTTGFDVTTAVVFYLSL